MAVVSQNAPYRLDEGIALEDTGLILGWGTPIADLIGFQSPEIIRHLNSVHLKWRSRACFGGLSCDVEAVRISEPPNPRAYHIYLAEFHWAHLELQAEWGESDAEVEQGFRQVFGHLESVLGPAAFSYPEYERGLPVIFWEFPRLLIEFSLLSGRPSISVAHEPAGYAALRAESLSQRNRGAMVDFVAWPGWRGRVNLPAAPVDD